MFESFLEYFLTTYMGEFLEGVKKENLKIAIWKGEIQISQVKIKKKLIEMLNLPIRLKLGKVTSMTIKVPWGSLGSKPVEVEIDQVVIVTEIMKIEDWEISESYQDFIKSKLQLVYNIFWTTLFIKATEEKKKGVYFFEYIFDNLRVNIKSMEFRIERNHKNHQKFAFGGKLKNVQVYTVDEENKSAFVIRKSKFDPYRKIIDVGETMVYHDSNVLENPDDYMTYLSGEKLKSIFHVSLKVMLKISPFNKDQEIKPPVHDFQVLIDNVNICFDDESIKSLKNFLDVLRLHSMTLIGFLGRQKYGYLRPLMRIRDTDDPESRRILARNWFKFGVTSVIKKKRSEVCGCDLFILPKEKEETYQEEAEGLLMKYLDGNSELDELEELKLNWLCQTLKLNTIIMMTKKVTVELFKSNKSEVIFNCFNYFKSNIPKFLETEEYTSFLSFGSLPEDFISIQGKIGIKSSNITLKTQGSELNFTVSGIEISAAKSLSMWDIKGGLSSV